MVGSSFRTPLFVAAVAAMCCAPQLWAGATDLSGKAQDPFASPGPATVLLFVRTDCPITNRYAPELQGIAHEFQSRGVNFWLVYPDRDESPTHVQSHIRDYSLPGKPLLDPKHELVKRAHATVAPEAAVFDHAGRLMYHGRIDDRYLDIGKTRPAAQVHDLEDAIQSVLTGKRIAHPETRAVGCSLADVE
jgi:hypothetical protein